MKKVSLILLSFLSLIFFHATIKANESGSISGPSTIVKEQYNILTLSDILSFYTSSLGGVSIESDGYTGNGAVLGQYEIVLNASNGVNLATKTITIEVIKSIGFGIKAVTNAKDLHIPKSYVLQPTDYVKVHEKVGLFRLNETTQVSILSDQYSKNAQTPGIYLVEYRLVDASGLDMTIAFNITVYESNNLENPIKVVERQPSQISKLFKSLESILTIALIVIIGLALFKFLKGVKK